MLVSQLIGLLIIIGFCWLFFRWFERNNIYFPFKEIEAFPTQIGLKYEDIYIQTQDRIQLNGWFVPSSDTAIGTILFCHGNAGNISHRLDKLKIFHELNLNTIIFDYRGYGRSKGSVLEKGTYLDARAVYDYLPSRKDIDPSKIILYGESLGCAIAIELARQKPNAAVVICESPFTSIADVGKEIYPFLPTKLLVSIRYDALSKIGEITIPILLIHSQNDEIIGFHHSERLYAAAQEPKELLVIHGSHNEGFLDSEDIYKKGITEFLKKYLK